MLIPGDPRHPRKPPGEKHEDERLNNFRKLFPPWKLGRGKKKKAKKTKIRFADPFLRESTGSALFLRFPQSLSLVIIQLNDLMNGFVWSFSTVSIYLIGSRGVEPLASYRLGVEMFRKRRNEKFYHC